MAETIKGKVAAVSVKNKVILIEGIWYKGTGKAVEYLKKELKGAIVEFKPNDNKGFDFIKIVSEAQKVPTKPSSFEDYPEAGRKMAFLKCACSVVRVSYKGNGGAMIPKVKTVMDYAKELEKEFNRWVD